MRSPFTPRIQHGLHQAMHSTSPHTGLQRSRHHSASRGRAESNVPAAAALSQVWGRGGVRVGGGRRGKERGPYPRGLLPPTRDGDLVVPAYQPRVAALVTEVLSDLSRNLAEVEDLAQLEHLVREVGLRFARRLAEIVLEGLDRLLSRQRPPGWREKDVRTRTLESTVGTLHLKRRRYRDAEGRWRYPLDEALKLAPQVQVTPELQRLMVELGSQMPFETASRLLHELMPTAPARSTLHRHLGRVGEACQQADERQRQEV